MSILCSAADAVSSDTWSMVFSVLTLNDAMLVVFLHLSRCVLCLCFKVIICVAGTVFSAGRAPFLSTQRAMRFGRGLCSCFFGRWARASPSAERAPLLRPLRAVRVPFGCFFWGGYWVKV